MRRLPLCLLLLALACGGEEPQPGPFQPPRPVEGQEPIPYPPDLYSQRVEGEVMLYLVIDTNGQVVRDSTRIVQRSGQNAFDAAAMNAASALRFVPAMRGDTAVMAPIQVPIQFVLPDSLRAPEPE